MVDEMVKILKCMIVNTLPSPLQLLSSKNFNTIRNLVSLNLALDYLYKCLSFIKDHLIFINDASAFPVSMTFFYIFKDKKGQSLTGELSLYYLNSRGILICPDTWIQFYLLVEIYFDKLQFRYSLSQDNQLYMHINKWHYKALHLIHPYYSEVQSQRTNALICWNAKQQPHWSP